MPTAGRRPHRRRIDPDADRDRGRARSVAFTARARDRLGQPDPGLVGLRHRRLGRPRRALVDPQPRRQLDLRLLLHAARALPHQPRAVDARRVDASSRGRACSRSRRSSRCACPGGSRPRPRPVACCSSACSACGTRRCRRSRCSWSRSSISLVIGVPLGVLSARRPGFDRSTRCCSTRCRWCPRTATSCRWC